MSIGDEFTIDYGQLKNITVRKGQKVKAGEMIGRVAKPTKYFSEEGANLYYKVKNKSATVNPMVFLK
jgi:septal ring factor EnvC (AmiA/AmiB activator)